MCGKSVVYLRQPVNSVCAEQPCYSNEVTLLTALKSAVRSHAPQYNKASMLLLPLGEGVQNVTKGHRLRQQRPVFSCCCCWSAPGLVVGSTGAADGEQFQISKRLFFLSFTQLDQGKYKQGCMCVCVVCVYYSIWN